MKDRQSPDGGYASAGAVALASGTAFGLLALLVVAGWSPLLDRDSDAVGSATDYTRAHGTYRAWIRGLTEALQSGWTQLYGAAAALGSLLRRRRGDAAWLVLVVGLGGLVWPALKQLVGRPRPVLDQPLQGFTGFSYPSGHASSAAILCAAVLVVAWSRLRTPGGRGVAVALAITVPVASGWSRFALGGHYPSDILAGYLLGTAWVAAWAPLLAVLRRRLAV